MTTVHEATQILGYSLAQVPVGVVDRLGYLRYFACHGDRPGEPITRYGLEAQGQRPEHCQAVGGGGLPPLPGWPSNARYRLPGMAAVTDETIARKLAESSTLPACPWNLCAPLLRIRCQFCDFTDPTEETPTP